METGIGERRGGALDHMGKSNVVGTTYGSRIVYVTKQGQSLVSFRHIRRVRNTTDLIYVCLRYT